MHNSSALLLKEQKSMKDQQQPSQELDGPTYDPRMCETHQDELILFCLKDQCKVCSKCLKSTHLLHPVVPLNSLENLDFSESL
jgi:hypothetical protein